MDVDNFVVLFTVFNGASDSLCDSLMDLDPDIYDWKSEDPKYFRAAFILVSNVSGLRSCWY